MLVSATVCQPGRLCIITVVLLTNFNNSYHDENNHKFTNCNGCINNTVSRCFSVPLMLITVIIKIYYSFNEGFCDNDAITVIVMSISTEPFHKFFYAPRFNGNNKNHDITNFNDNNHDFDVTNCNDYISTFLTLYFSCRNSRRASSQSKPSPQHTCCCCAGRRGWPNHGGRYQAGPLGWASTAEEQIKQPNYEGQSRAMSQLLVSSSPALHRRGPQVPPPQLTGAAPAITASSGGCSPPSFSQPQRLAPSIQPPTAARRPWKEMDVEECVIVNPLGALSAPLGTAERTVTSGYSERPLGSLPIPREPVRSPACTEEEGEEGGTEPIYAEIRAPGGVGDQVKELTEGAPEVLKNKLAPVEGTKKGVEYWQITTKEMARFRPCTQILIRR
jgi:hypothetical protein